MAIFIVKLVYFFLYRKYWEGIENDEKIDKKAEILDLNDMQSI